MVRIVCIFVRNSNVFPSKIVFFALIIANLIPSIWITQAEAQELTETELSWSEKGKIIKKSIFCLGAVPGTLKKKSLPDSFVKLTETISSLKKKRAPTKKISLFQKLQKLGKKACKEISGGGGGGSIPQPTPTSAPAFGNFDSGGNVTTQGKALFQIPASLTANVSAGKSAVASYCTGCHTEKLSRTFTQLRVLIRASPMLYDESQIPDSTLANITAYLNRYRVN